MKDIRLLIYYIILLPCLVLVLIPNTFLNILTNIIFCLVSIISYYIARKNHINLKDIYFIISLSWATIGSFASQWRHFDLGITFETSSFLLMFLFFIFSIKCPKQYLFLGTQWVLIFGVFAILLLILYFTTRLLPYIPDMNIPLSILFVFVVGFIFIISLNRAVADQNYILFFLGCCSLIASSIVAGTSIYHAAFSQVYFWENALFLLGICIITSNMIKNNAFDKNLKKDLQRNPNISLIYFLKKIFC